MKEFISFIKTVLVTTIIFVVVGFFVGISLGGGWGAPTGGGCTDIKGTLVCYEGEKGFVYRDEYGYEGGGLLGIHIGTLAGLAVGVYIWKRRNKKLPTS